MIHDDAIIIIGAGAAGLMAAATHGWLRTAHAVRSLTARETPERIAELARGLAYWAARYQEVPGPARPSGTLAIAAGIAGFHYQQVTGDSGAGARLGDFKGRVTSLGPVVTYNFNLGKIPVSTQLMWTHDFDVENRLEGDLGILTVSMPLSVGGH